MRDYPSSILEAWATWEVLRKLDFSADVIFWEIAPTLNAQPMPGLALNIVLRAQDKVFTVTCSRTLAEEAAQQIERDSAAFFETLNEGGFENEMMLEVLHASFVWRNKVDLLRALGDKGFRLPASKI